MGVRWLSVVEGVLLGIRRAGGGVSVGLEIHGAVGALLLSYCRHNEETAEDGDRR